MTEGRSMWRMLFNNMRNSIKLLPPKGKLMGQDHLGNKYFEAPVNVYSNRKSASRWFKPEIEGDWQQNLPAEWEAWLRGRRKDAPTEEEVMGNLAVAKSKKIKGAEIEAKFKKAEDNESRDGEKSKGFPKLKDYEREAGQFSDNKNKYE